MANEQEKVVTPNQEEKKKKRKKFLIPLFCILGAGAIAGASVGIYFGVKGNQEDNTPDVERPLTFECVESGELFFREVKLVADLNLESSTNGTEWKPVEITKPEGQTYYGAKFNCVAGQKLLFRGNNHTFNDLSHSPDTVAINSFLCNTGKWNVRGNVMSLLDKTNFATLNVIPGDTDGCFNSLFSTPPLLSNEEENAESYFRLTDASKLHLPTGLAKQCFAFMFFYCQIEKAPMLPAVETANGCYTGMFGGCDLLKVAPDLPAPTEKLTNDCYSLMFVYSAIESLKVGFDQNAFPGTDTPYTQNWLAELVSEETNEKKFFWKGTTEPTIRNENTIPEGWTITNY